MDHLGKLTNTGRGTEVETVQVFVLHGGEWADKPCGTRAYCSNKVAEIMFLPRDCTYKHLVDMVHSFFNLSPSVHRITMTYGCKTSVGIVVLHIRNDTDVQHFLHFNMRVDATTPLCLLIEGESYDFPMQADKEYRPIVNANPSFSKDARESSRGSTHVPSNPDVPAQDELVEDIGGNEDVEQDEFDFNCSPNDNGVGEAELINQEDVVKLHKARSNEIEKDLNVDILIDGNNDTVSTKDLGASMRPSANTSNRRSYVVIEKDQLFCNKKELRRHVNLHAVTHNFEFKVFRSNKKLFVAKCLTAGCKWRVRAIKLHNSNYFKVSKVIPTHTCSRGIIDHDHRQASSWLIGQCIKSRCEGGEHSYKPKDIIDDVWRELGINISYDKAWRARELALNSIRGTAEESYAILPSYCAMLEAKNPGSMTAIQTDEANHFKNLFISIGACIKGFHNSIRPVIVVNCTLLKSKYLGTLFMATCMDGNNQIYPIAFGIGDSENEDDTSWEWFLTKLKDVVCEAEGLVFVSDQNCSIQKAIKKVFPHAVHGICIYYLSQNLKAKFKNSALVPLFNTAAKVHHTIEFGEIMREITRCDANAAKYLIETGVERWARAHFNGMGYNIMTTNIVESVNAIMKDAKELPVTMLIDHLRGLLQEWFHDRRTAAANMKSFLSDWAESEVCRKAELSNQYCVRPIDCYEVEMFDGDRKCVVNLHTKTCSCREFDLEQLPCAHALAAARYCHVSVNGLCSPFYTTSCLMAAYAESINPVGHKEDWEITEEVRSRVVLPPLMREPSKRKWKKKKLSTSVDRRRKCGRCGGIGHNRQTCNEPISCHPRKRAKLS